MDPTEDKPNGSSILGDRYSTMEEITINDTLILIVCIEIHLQRASRLKNCDWM